MASITDVFNALNDIKGKLDQLHADNLNNGGKLDTVNQSVNNTGGAITARLTTLVQGQALENQLTYHLTLQGETIICALEHISKNTCELVNLTTEELESLRKIQERVRVSCEVLRIANADAALEVDRNDEIYRKMEKCCPDKPEDPPCHYKPCKNPGSFKMPERENPQPPG
jgi:hypothetical protein